MALKYVADFNFDDYAKGIKAFLGKGADKMIKSEKTDKKYDAGLHKKRLDKIVEKWNCILKIINEELISVERFSQLLDKINSPKSLAEIGVDENIIKEIFVYTKDIRDKYVLSRLCWDLGIIDSISL